MQPRLTPRKAVAAATLLALAGGATACELPGTELSNTITTGFRIQVQNASVPEVHNKYFNLFEAGGGDHHLFIGPVGVPTYDLTLVNGVITKTAYGIRAVIGGEYSEIDTTTKMFMTGRGDPRAVFQPTWGCNPDTDEVQVELAFVGWENHPQGGHICVRRAFENGHEFRYSPPGNTNIDYDRPCLKVQLVALVGASPPTTTIGSTTTTSPTTTPTTFTTTTTSSSTTTTTPPTGTPDPTAPFTDKTSSGWRYLGCAPEERRATDGPGRTLPDALYSEDALTHDKCFAFCDGAGYKYAGTEWRRECWCANVVRPGRVPADTLASLAGCDHRCNGDNSEFCGGDAWLSLYEKCEAGQPCENQVFV